MHVVGDCHQPLHNTKFFNATYPKGDLGGKSLLIKVILYTLILQVEEILNYITINGVRTELQLTIQKN